MSITSQEGTLRVEAIERIGSSRPLVLVPGVELQPLAGASSGVRGLFTGQITLAPGATLPCYARSTTEALVVLAGEPAVEVEGRRYRLEPLDAIAVMSDRPRRIVNLSDVRAAVLHVAIGTPTPSERWVNGRFETVSQPAGAIGREGCERLVRHASAPVTELAPGAMFRDLYNAGLGSRGICGGHGVFAPGARLPCHRHQFDESITIVEGTATCVVEGRRHELSGFATAMVPEGRCHYFINLTLETMAMIWVYAGDMPDRIVMDERYCHPEPASR